MQQSDRYYLTRRVACPCGYTTLAGVLHSAPAAVPSFDCSSSPRSCPRLGVARLDARLAGEKEEMDDDAIEEALSSSLSEQRMLRAVRL